MALEFFIKNLCIEIQQECKDKEIECHQNFMTYYLGLLAYDPIWNLFPKMNEIIREDALRLIKYAVEKMRYQMCPCIIALRTQFYFTCNFETKDDIVDVSQSNFRVRLLPLIEEIVEAKPADEAEYDMLLKHIIYYSTLWRGLGDPTHESVYKECYHATISFLDNSDLDEFTQSKPEEKLLQLNDIAQISGGVRLFNWTCKKGGKGIDDVPEMLANNINLFKMELTQRLQSKMDKIDILTSAIDYCFIIEPYEVYRCDDTVTEFKQSCELPMGIEYEEIEFFKDLIIVYRQKEGFLRQLLDVVAQMETTYDELGVKFQECLERFNSLTHFKAGVPTRVIFPLFIELDNIWELYQNEIVYLKRMYQIMLDLDLYTKDFNINFDKLEIIIDDREILNDADRSIISENEEYLEEEMFGLEVILPTSKEFKLNEMKLELLGFDIWRLVESQGALIPGNPNLGVVVFENKNYVFSCKESAFMFAKYPNQCFNEMLELARKKVELITLLDLQTDLARVQTIKQLVSHTKLMESNVPHDHAGVQTELHPIEPNSDYNCMWNIWDHKRAALRLCTMSHMATNTASTHAIHVISTQTYELKEATQQTLKDNYTNTHTPQTYFFGLRGRKDDKQFILDLTKPPEKS